MIVQVNVVLALGHYVLPLADTVTPRMGALGGVPTGHRPADHAGGRVDAQTGREAHRAESLRRPAAGIARALDLVREMLLLSLLVWSATAE